MVIFVLVVESNVINLIDGVDGLVVGIGAIVFVGLGLLVVKENLVLVFFCCVMVGGCIGFVYYNYNFVWVFMGDMGFLVLGGSLVVVGIMIGNFWGLLLISGIFLVEFFFVIV